MSCSELPSAYLVEIREELKPHVHGGRFFTSEDVGNLVRRLNTAITLAEEVEEEKRDLERRERLSGGRQRGLAVVGPNVVAFPGHAPTGGGRA
ncbi:hypothetical protein B5K08_15970 [Rhizobium leguminosarum bv. trifolii]|uniref:Uncharacterized protein n=1 Tax=Rhizobium leguminosarum bv. trifolii TaxID=386 RepID=A0A3E1BH76_RHILT|nr:hypothetical protein [Rhizobium leguminosarum]RFB91791.1 hypothetical protein B5K08_15970 [Rhizobium leguminosarum bv. trifolii]RFB92308.1 hypothetical protein B5K10_15965 [Rhizobium leguminosarum bv. trifolii]